ncbi:MAG TPA: hypothetical protein VGD74_08825 [Vulgatibacter sp.]
MRSTLAATVALALTGACAHQNVLIPAPGAALASDGGATGKAAGVRIDVRGDAWKGDPRNLGDYLTPVLVEIANDGDRPIQVRYSDFALVGQSGFRYAALPPFKPMGTAYGSLEDGGDPGAQGVDEWAAPPRPDIDAPASVGATASGSRARSRDGDASAAPATETAGHPSLPLMHAGHRHFFVAPYQAPYYGYFSPWPYPFGFDSLYWGQYYYAWVEPLPTPTMMNDALPEGVLEPGGSIGGFVYFQNVTPREGRVTFLAHFVDAKNQQSVGEIRVPLVTARE